MKLLRYGPHGHEKSGLLDKTGQIRDLSATIRDLAGSSLSIHTLELLGAIDPNSLPLVPDHPRIGPCVGRVGKFICIGLNYSDHAAESGMQPPAEPVVFMKATS